MKTIITITCLLFSSNALACNGTYGCGGSFDKGYIERDSSNRNLTDAINRLNDSLNQNNGNYDFHWE